MATRLVTQNWQQREADMRFALDVLSQCACAVSLYRRSLNGSSLNDAGINETVLTGQCATVDYLCLSGFIPSI